MGKIPIHSESTPNLMGPKPVVPNVLASVIKEEDENSDVESELDLLEYLERIQYEYRTIEFDMPDDPNYKSETTKKYERRVAFDTINIQCDDDDDFDPEDSFNRTFHEDPFSSDTKRRRDFFSTFDAETAGKYGPYNLFLQEARGRSRSPTPSPLHSPLHSPSSSPSRMPLPFPNSIDVAHKLHTAPQYPTKPIITHRGCTFTKLHRKFEDLYLKRLYNKQHNYLRPVLPLRVILVYVSGRIHTWVALDWILSTFIEHGDSVIIVSAVDPQLLYYTRKRKSIGRYGSVSPDAIKDPKSRLRERRRPEHIKLIAKNIMNYAMEVINPDIIARVSIELAVGDTKHVMKEMYKLYEPSLVCTGTKPRPRASAPLRSWNSSRLTDRLVKNFPVPVIVVPAVKLGQFEKHLRNTINQRHLTAQDMSNKSSYNSSNTYSSYSSVDTGDSGHSIPSQSLLTHSRVDNNGDDQSISSLSSEESYSSFDEIANTYANYKKTLSTKLKGLSKEGGYGEKYFVDALKTISDKSVDLCNEIISIQPDFLGRGAKLAHIITGSARFGYAPYRTKSLLTPVEAPPPLEKSKSEVAVLNANNQGMSLREIKRKLKEKQLLEQQVPNTPVSVPQISIILNSDSDLSPEPSETPKLSSLRFLETSTSSRAKVRSTKMMHKSLSNDDGGTGTRIVLEPSKSHQDLTSLGRSMGAAKSDHHSSTKKRLKFWRLFSS